MTVFLLIVGIGLVTFSLIYDYFITKNQTKKFHQISQETNLEIKKFREAEQHLKEEIDILENKLRLTLEDPVTNLLGKELFENRLELVVNESARYQFNMAVLLIDIDHFGLINDALNYEVGNLLLQEVGQRLQACIRQVDSIARFSGDTFAVLLSQLSKPETVAIIAQRMLQEVVQPFYIKEHELYITACIGIALFPSDGKDPYTLIKKAEHALSLAKDKGKNIYQFYQKEMFIKSQRELALYNSLSRESIFQEYILSYQPIVNIDTGTVICMDTILHWQHAQFGLINSNEIFALAEKQSKLNLISEWLIEKTCKQFLDWQLADFNPNLVAISLSVKQLENSHFIHRLSQILQKIGFNPVNLLIQARGNFSLASFDVIEKTFNMLNYLGIKIAIDDFGANLLPLRYLKMLKAHYLKLDPSFASDLVASEQTKVLLKSVIYLAENMGMAVIAQGIELEEQVKELRRLGCVLLQGSFLGKSLKEQEVIEKMGSKTPIV